MVIEILDTNTGKIVATISLNFFEVYWWAGKKVRNIKNYKLSQTETWKVSRPLKPKPSCDHWTFAKLNEP